jgi:DNA topoisomerase-1
MASLQTAYRAPSKRKRRRAPTPQQASPVLDPVAAARSAGLRYTCDTTPGLRRVRQGKGFRYIDPDGRPVRDRETLRRINALAIPPAWTEVWICPTADGHLQATGRDARRRKQYRYHPRWRSQRDNGKYEKMLAFARALPGIRAQVARDLALPGLPRRKVLAAVVRLLETTLIRVGNDEYARQNGSFGLTTLRDRHAIIEGATVRFRFRGKSGIAHDVTIDDHRLGRIVARCQDLPGQELFQYRDDDGQARDVGSSDVNDYLREVGGEHFTAKDFRTWAGTVLAALALREFEAFDSAAAAKRNIVRAVESVARRLGNTPAVCRKSYVHPAIFDAYLDGLTVETLRRRARRALRDVGALTPEEAAVLALLLERLEREPAAEQGVSRRAARAGGLRASAGAARARTRAASRR